MIQESPKVKTIYGVILPIVTVILLLGVASFLDRAQIGSHFFTLLIRLILSLWFSGLYIRLSRFSEYRPYPNITWSKEDVGPFEKYVLIGVCVLFGLGCGLITWWTISMFFTSNLFISILGGAVNFLIVSIPMVSRYWVMKI